LYLSYQDVENVGLTMADMIDVVEEAYKEKGKGEYQLPHKIALHTYQPGDFIHAMPAYIPAMKAAGVKIVSGYSLNYKQNYSYINGVYVLICVETGIPLAIMDAVWITAMRTGAVTGLSAKYLANKDSETVGIIGTGVQGRTNLEALMLTLGRIKKVYAYDFFPGNSKKFAEEMQEQYNIEVIAVEDREQAIVNSDILISAIPCVVDQDNEFIEKEWLKEGMTALPVDLGVLYKPDAIVEPFKKIYTDDIGQFEYFKGEGFFRSIPHTPPEIGKMLVGDVPARENHTERIIALNIGTGIADLASAKKIYDLALKKGMGTVLQL